ncbi:hypothetical protein FVEN_g13192 [Fusarium venenatum]|nr:hypothetical protein FVEN_g13192 [Fusarium venenatum]
MPYSRCFRCNLIYKAKDEKSNRYSNCIEAKVVCDSSGVATFHRLFPCVFMVSADFSLVSRNIKERKKVKEDKHAAEEALEEAMARLACIRKIKRYLKEQGNALFVYRMQSLEDCKVPVINQVKSLTVNKV